MPPENDKQHLASMNPSDRRESLLGPQSTGLAAALLKAAGDLTTSDKAKREGYLAEKFELGGRPFVDRVKKYGRTEDGDNIIWSPWLEELLETIGDARISDVSTMAASQIAKAQPLDAKVLTPAGFTTMGRIKVGDEVIAADGSPTKVLGVYPQGIKEVYDVVFDDGSKTQCCDEHLWVTQTPNERQSKDPFRRLGTVRSLEEIRNTLYRTRKDGTLSVSKAGNPESYHSIDYIKPADLTPSVLGIHPYIMGVLLGDGCLSIKGQVTFSNPEQQIVDTVRELLPHYLHLTQRKADPITYQISAEVGYHSREKNDVLKEVRKQGLEGKLSPEKHIPPDYLESSISDRLWLLRGLMDTDGYITGTEKDANGGTIGSATFGSSSEQLAKDAWQLILSLGGNPKPIGSQIPKYRHNGELREGRRSYRFVFSLPEGLNPFHVERKAF